MDLAAWDHRLHRFRANELMTERPRPHRDSGPGLFAYEDSPAGAKDAKVAFQHSDDEDERAAHSRAQERAVPKPTIHLSSLPPGTSPAVIKSILPDNLQVEAVRILPPSGPGNTERRSFSAIVTLAKDTPAIDIDTAVSALQNKYLGWGFYLSLSRHLSSAAVGSGMPAPLGAPLLHHSHLVRSQFHRPQETTSQGLHKQWAIVVALRLLHPTFLQGRGSLGGVYLLCKSALLHHPI